MSGRRELAPVPGVTYVGFVDPAGGSGDDSMTMAIAHRDSNGVIVLDCVREVRPGFSPKSVVDDFAAVFRSYGIHQVVGDAWGGEFVREPFMPLQYILSKKKRSEIYRDTLALLNSRRVQLLDHPVLIAQLCSLERSTGRGGNDSIDHPKGQHDDVCMPQWVRSYWLTPTHCGHRFTPLSRLGRTGPAMSPAISTNI